MLSKLLPFLLFAIAPLSSCSNSETLPAGDELALISSYKIDVKEPSGLGINDSGDTLYTVSDQTNQIYALSLTGDVLRIFNYRGNDLEGVTVVDERKLLIAEERKKQLIAYDLTTDLWQAYSIDYENNESNSGLEGVAYNKVDGSVFILNEKNPGLLLRLRSDFSVIQKYALHFASDYSGIFHDSETNQLWIVSDQSKTLNRCTLRGERIESYSINIDKAEGVAMTKDKIYIVSDADARLYVFKKPIKK